MEPEWINMELEVVSIQMFVLKSKYIVAQLFPGWSNSLQQMNTRGKIKQVLCIQGHCGDLQNIPI